MTQAQALVIQIDNIIPHDNADALEIVIVGGYNIIVKKDSLKIGDRALYISVDSLVPDEILEHHGIAQYVHKNRIKTIKLRGAYSQGLVLPLTFPGVENAKLGDDLAKKLKIEKYLPPLPGSSRPGKKKPKWAINISKFLNRMGLLKIKRYLPYGLKMWGINLGIFDFRNFWPSGLVIYDIENIQNPLYKDVFTESDYVIATEKIHGRHVVAGYYNGEFFVGSRRINIDRPYGTRQFDINWTPILDADLEEKLDLIRQELGYDQIAIRSENFGPGCQYLHYGVDKPTFIAFDIECPFGNYLPSLEFERICSKYNISRVPVLYSGPFNYEKLAQIAELHSTLAGNNNKPKHLQEGLVIEAANSKERDVKLGRKMLKLISPLYLLKSADEDENLDE